MKCFFTIFFFMMVSCAKKVDSNNDLLRVTTTQYYRASNGETRIFPKDEFYSFKMGQNKSEVIRIFGEPSSEYKYRNSDLGCISYYTDRGGLLGLTEVYCWEFVYDKNDIIIKKNVFEESS